MATIECVTEVLDLFARSKPGTNIKDFEKVAQAWYLVLEPLADEWVMGAAVRLARQGGDFLPSAGAVYEAALDDLDPEPNAAEAWATVEKHARGKDVSLSNRMLAALGAMPSSPGDWQEDELAFRRRDFLTEFARQRNKWRREARAGRLALSGGPKVQNSELLMEGGNG